MKITKRQLRRIIKESLLLESTYDDAHSAQIEKDRADIVSAVATSLRSDIDIAAEQAASFDAKINNSVNVGSLSNSDAVDEIQARLESMGEDVLVDEIEKMIENDADDIVDVLEIIPDEIKAKFTI